MQPHPRTRAPRPESGPRRPRTPAALALAVAVLLAGATVPAAAQVEDPEVREAQRELREARERVRARREKVRAIQERIDAIATRISEVQSSLDETELEIRRARRAIEDLRAELAEIQREIDERSRHAFILGPATGLQMVLASDTYVELTRAIGLLEELNSRDAELAAELLSVQERMNVRQAELEQLELRRIGFLFELGTRRRELREAFREQREVLERLRVRREQARIRLSELRPFAVCPVDGPHAIADDFGGPRVDVIEVVGKDGKVKRKERRRKHQGNDIFAPLGTPIVAPFDGVAVDARNELGGLAVKVIGEFGYVYNAHLSRYGKLGPVETGDVIGYVGTTGNARGTSPHNHFEWHPDGGPAVDPNPFLLLVC
ncbi:MAG TPA: peptidoglycan DD-metalloendopeptidase family protein [Actinomycetota bacterium]|nr:peptidoglycan DD-metalloendopeptidase family protein [Actinomycetota bacterium]